MANPSIKIKRSSVAGKVPHYPSTIDVGEFAINTADGKVFIAAGVGAGVTVQEVGISTQHVLSSGIGTFGNETVVVGAAQTQFLVRGNGRVVGILTCFGLDITGNSLAGNINSSGISTISGFTFPSSDGSEDQALVTDGSGGLSFKTLGGGGAVGGATSISVSNTISTQGQTVFTTPNVFDDGEQATPFSVLVSVNGTKQRLGASNDYQLSAPQTVTFGSGLTVGDNVQITVYFGHTFEEEHFISTQNQIVFTLAGNLSASKNYRVYLNGVRLRRDIDYQASAAVILTQGSDVGDEIDICSDQAEDQLTAIDNQTLFSPANADTSSDNMEVYLNGVLLQRTTDWSIGSPAITIINPVTGLDVGDELDVVVRRS
jgi:hypothetical protein